MTRTHGSALRLTMALLVGLGAGALWRAGGGRPDRQGGEHADHAAGPEALPGTNPLNMHMDDTGSATGPVGYAIDLDNDICPIMGNEPKGEVYVHWRGLRVQLCCALCEEGFLDDPEGTLRELGVDPTASLEAIAKLRATDGPEHEALLAELSSRFNLVELEPGQESQ